MEIRLLVYDVEENRFSSVVMFRCALFELFACWRLVFAFAFGHNTHTERCKTSQNGFMQIIYDKYSRVMWTMSKTNKNFSMDGKWFASGDNGVYCIYVCMCIELLWYGDKLHEKWLQTISIYHFSLEYENTCETVDSMLWLMMCSKVIKLKVESISAKRRIRYGYYKYREGSESGWAVEQAGRQDSERVNEWLD